MDLQNAKMELLIDASKNRNQILKVEKADGAYVKGYSLPEERRFTYIAALESLLQEGAVKPIFKNREMQVFGVTAAAAELVTLRSATQRLLEEFQENGYVYKIHGASGEFVQCGSESFESFDYTRILFIRALNELLYSGKIDVVDECRQMCTYALSATCPAWNAQTGFETKVRRLPTPVVTPSSVGPVVLELPTNIRSA